jgi:hypothetical protein
MSELPVIANFEIHPEPSEEEAAIIVTALTGLSASAVPTTPEPARPQTNRWQLAGRRAALSASPSARQRWNRELAWLGERT